MIRDAILVGGGLSSGLIAWRLAEDPKRKILLLERGSAPGGNHTWSFHGTDLPRGAWRWLEPLVSKSWMGYDVRFPRRVRALKGTYHSIRSEDLAARLSARLGDRLRCGARVWRIGAGEVELEGGERLRARAILDGRGFGRGSAPRGYQKFLGQDLVLRAPHGLKRPLLMDATVEQRDGYRFFYLLPWDERRLLVEDTRYSDTSAVDVQGSRADILAYVSAKGWTVESCLREEIGSLPIPLSDEAISAQIGAASVGVRAGLFHPTTGYSLPEAVRLAEAVAALPDLSTETVTATVAARRRRQQGQWGYLRLLNRMLFLGAGPSERRDVFERFYGLSEGTLSRFYAGSLSYWDRGRILVGKPPIPLARALHCLREPAVLGVAHG